MSTHHTTHTTAAELRTNRTKEARIRAFEGRRKFFVAAALRAAFARPDYLRMVAICQHNRRSSSSKMGLLVFVVLLFSATTIQAADFFVDSVLGEDITSCGDVSTPCRTITYADTRAIGEPGDAALYISGTFLFFNESRIPNSGGWNQLIGDPSNPRNVVIDGDQTTERVVYWFYSDNNQTGPFYFNGITFTGFTDKTIELVGQHLDVRNCIFDSTGEIGSLSIEAGVSRSSDVWQETTGSNTSTIFVENVVTYSSSRRGTMCVHCNGCYNATVLNSQFFNSSTPVDSSRGAAALKFSDAVSVVVENIQVTDTHSCSGAVFDVDDVDNVVLRNIEIRGVFPALTGCSSDDVGSILIEDSEGLVEIENLNVYNATGGQGSGMYLQASNNHVILRNCHFEDMVALSSGSLYVDGGSDEGDFILEIYDCAFINNKAEFAAGGIDFRGGVTNVEVILERVEFLNNRVVDTQGVGGAINVQGDNYEIRFSNGSIVGHSAGSGGAVHLSISESSELILEDIVITDNDAAEGGALYTGGSAVLVKECLFERNSASKYGGCVYTPRGVGSSSTLEIMDTTFTDCTAQDNGGAIYNDGGMLNINDTTLARSIAGIGGGIFIGQNAVAHVAHSKIAESNAGGEGFCVGILGYGGGVYFEDNSCAAAEFNDVLFEHNSANVSGGAYYTQNVSCSDSWCTNCEFTGNLGRGFGSRRAAPFSRFRPEGNGRHSVSIGESFRLDVVPHDAYDQPMRGEHELIRARIQDQPPSSALFVCGDPIATASRGLAHFSLEAFLIDLGDSTIRDSISAGEDADVSLMLAPPDHLLADNTTVEIPLTISSCDEGYELDLISADEVENVVIQCMGSLYTEDVEIPALMRCEEVTTLSDAQQIAVIVMTFLTLIIGLSLTLSAIYFRKNRVVWSSSLSMLFVSVLGFLMLEAASVLRAFHPTSTAMCMSFEWLLILGLNLFMGAAYTKNLRIWKIFTLKTLKVVDIPNWKLVFAIAVACIPEIITLTIQTTMFPLTVETALRNSTCGSDTEGAFMVVYGLMKALWLAGGLGISFLVRKVPEKFNDMKGIVAIVSVIFIGVTIMWAIGGIVDTQKQTVLEVLTTALVAVCLVAVVIVPKLYLIYKKRDGTLLSSSTNGGEGTQTQDTFSNFDKKSSFRRAKSAVHSTSEDSSGFAYKDRFRHLEAELKRTQRLYERSYENTQELRGRFRNIEADLIALQFEREYRADVLQNPHKPAGEKRDSAGQKV